LTDSNTPAAGTAQVLDRAPESANPVPASSPGRHLLTLIVDALQLPEPAPTPESEAAYLSLVNRRAGLVLHACRRALSGHGDGAVLYAARDLFDGVSCLPATGYDHARTGPGMSA
jgi:hypothetical protein